MTKFKKCDYCKQKSSNFHKLKSVNELFDGKDKVLGYHSGGGYIKQRAIIMFLCHACYEYFFPEDIGKEHVEGSDIRTIPELAEIMNKKCRKPL